MQSDNSSFAMASFGIAEDPDAAARSKRVKIFAASMAVVIALAGFWLSRSSHETAPVAKQAEKTEKPAPVAAAPATPAPSASAAAVAEKPKEEPKPEERPAKTEAKHRRRAKKSAD